ncbi:MAG: YkgJ family cysteine cluster protein [Nanoarchaeota archaeon]
MSLVLNVDQSTGYQCPSGCTYCCEVWQPRVPIFYAEAARMADKLRLPLERITLDAESSTIDEFGTFRSELILSKVNGLIRDSPCSFYDNGCGEYENRPNTCRLFPNRFDYYVADNVELRLVPLDLCYWHLKRTNKEPNMTEIQEIAELEVRYVVSQLLAFRKLGLGGNVKEASKISFEIFKGLTIEKAVELLVRLSKGLKIEGELDYKVQEAMILKREL